MRKKMDELTQAKLVYSIELGVFSIAFLVIAILEFCKIITISDKHLQIFNWVTIIGSSLLICDFIWLLCSKKRQAKNSFLDKVILIPLESYIITFDIICFVNNRNIDPNLFQYGIPSALTYICVAYGIEAIYHWYVPIPSLVDEVNKEIEKEKQDKLKADKSEETNNNEETNKD